MSIFVVDANVYSHSFNNLAFDVFADIYEPWSLGMINGTILSVDEVCRELNNFWGAEDAVDNITKKDKRSRGGKWLKEHKSAFHPMTDEEGKIVADIFKNKKFREGVKEKSLRMGTPEADAILVAKAKCIGGIIVTAESNYKANAEKVPNICVAFDVPYITKDDFYRVLRNIYSGKPKLENVVVHQTLDLY